MANETKKPTPIERLQEEVRFIAEFDLTEALKNFSSVENHIKQFIPQLEALISLAGATRDTDWKMFPNAIIDEFLKVVSQTSSILKSLASFKIDPNKSPNEQVQPIVRSLQQVQGNQSSQPYFPLIRQYQEISQYLGTVGFLQGTHDLLLKNADGLKGKTEELEKYLADRKGEIESLIQSVRDATGKAGVDRHSKEFSDLAKHHGQMGNAWMAVVFFLTLVSIVASLVLFSYAWNKSASSEAAVLVSWFQFAPKLLLVSMLYSSVLWSSKNYRSHRHLHVLNTQKATALETFRTFVGASEGDRDVKNAVLMECTKSIFNLNESGYSSAGRIDRTAPGLSIVEVVRAFNKSDSHK